MLSLLSVKVEGDPYLKDQTVSFNEGFNTLSGVNGSGKTLLVHAIRFGLNGKSDDSFYTFSGRVTLGFRLPNRSEVEYSKAAGRMTRYWIDGKEVSSEEYAEGLEEIEITPNMIGVMVPGVGWGKMGTSTDKDLLIFIENTMQNGQKMKGECDILKKKIRISMGAGTPKGIQKPSETTDELQKKLAAVKKRRSTALNRRINTMSSNVDKLYKKLNGNANQMAASFRPENPEEPYAGVEMVLDQGYGIMEPSNLSGGEKKIASIAINLAAVRVLQCPFVIYDNFDENFSRESCNSVGIAFRELVASGNLQIIAVCKQDAMKNQAPHTFEMTLPEDD
ncbi:hypothetical protein CRE_07623 [Caenorhabditis remanei]|uniref:Uncharacterized protein n=1 Tax=Caenorhabditis remanei TaxID=31234 RepID=E3MPA4_CAERE|nr:hypothetical protein CRE_07623 [Caenorhabditis remanei]